MFPMSDCKPGEWYLVVTCDGCKIKLPFLGDLSEGKSEIKGSYVITCPQCRHNSEYDSDRIERYQHPHSVGSS